MSQHYSDKTREAGLLPHDKFNYRGAMGRSTVDIECPCCGSVTTAYVWSLGGCGKRCDGKRPDGKPCGALHSRWGTRPAKDDNGPWGGGAAYV